MLTAHVQIFSGDPAGATETLEASMRLDPHCLEVLLHFLADARFSLGEYTPAIALRAPNAAASRPRPPVTLAIDISNGVEQERALNVRRGARP
jgi:hypothetical protein